VRRIPHQYKYRSGVTKYVLKRALEPILPRNILYRPKKGFGVPIGTWFREGALDFPQAVSWGALDSRFIQRKYEDHRASRSDERAFLWNAWLLAQWQTGSVDAPARATNGASRT